MKSIKTEEEFFEQLEIAMSAKFKVDWPVRIALVVIVVGCSVLGTAISSWLFW